MNGFNNNGNNGFNQQQGNGGFNQQGNFQQGNQGGNFQQQGGNFGGNQQQGNFQGGSAPTEMFIDMNEQASTGFGLLPNGRYNLEITAAEFAATSTNSGYVLKLQHTVIDGEFAGRTLFDNYNIQNSNQQAQQIGQRDYAALCKALYGDGYREKNPTALIGKRWVGDIDQHKQKKKNQNPDMWSQDSEGQQQEPEVRNRITARSPYRGNQQQGQQVNNQPMSQGGNQQFQQPQNNGNFQQPQNQQPGNFQQPNNQQGGNNQFQQQPGNGGVQMAQSNQQGQNFGGYNQVLQGGANGNSNDGMNQQQPGNNGFNQNPQGGNNGFNQGGNGGGFPNQGGSNFPQM